MTAPDRKEPKVDEPIGNLRNANGTWWLDAPRLLNHTLFSDGRKEVPLYIKAPALAAEVERLTGALAKANAQAEEFERKWYLRGDEVERLRDAVILADSMLVLAAHTARGNNSFADAQLYSDVAQKLRIALKDKP